MSISDKESNYGQNLATDALYARKNSFMRMKQV